MLYFILKDLYMRICISLPDILINKIKKEFPNISMSRLIQQLLKDWLKKNNGGHLYD